MQSVGKMSKRLGGIIDCKDKKNSSWHLNRFPYGSNIGQQYNTGEKPTVMLYTYIRVILNENDNFEIP